MSRDFWTKERVATLRRMWRKKVRVAEIAASIGCTRNAVIGKAHRIGLENRSDERGDIEAVRAARWARPAAHAAQSRVMSARFADPDWRARWHAARWGRR